MSLYANDTYLDMKHIVSTVFPLVWCHWHWSFTFMASLFPDESLIALTRTYETRHEQHDRQHDQGHLQFFLGVITVTFNAY